MGQTLSVIVGPGIKSVVGDQLISSAELFGLGVKSITEFSLVHVQAELDSEEVAVLTERLLADSLGQWCQSTTEKLAVAGDSVIETGLRPGVTDREGAELVRAAGELGINVKAATMGKRYVIEGDLTADEQAILAERVLHNTVIERWSLGTLPPAFTDSESKAPGVESVEIVGLDSGGLAAVNQARRLGLDPEEMAVIEQHFGALGRNPTDAEIETLAQTWSEHCAHKTFRAHITMDDGEKVNGLMKMLRATTDAIAAPWVRSAFVDNAGIVAFDDHFDLALKAETHNHPSALEPFGGANTGVGGVVRDILGVSAKPIAISDILCFGPEETDPADLPEGVLHPKRIRDGVIAGIGDYGNKIGVPNIGGAIVHDPGYTTTPLVFAGCLGLLPTGSNPTNAQPGDSIVVLGGAVGRDGVGGATFSSQTMGVETADVAGSSVQIGDPIVEKGLIDVVLQARDQKLYSAITDCGAGGLSSAVGEMAEVLGAEVDLQLVPRKYPGLAPWEVWLSEAQERMVLATSNPDAITALADRWSVGSSVIGTFTGKGHLVVTDGDAEVINISCQFLHDGRPRRQMNAVAPVLSRPDRDGFDQMSFDPVKALLDLLAHPSIRSNEAVIRTYDHEVMGGTLVRPYGGVEADGPADGTAMIPPGTSGDQALAMGIGVNALLGDLDPEAMAWHVVDEAVRNAVIAGADPSQLSLLDNFGWGNPTDPETLGRLVSAVKGCCDAALAFGAPFVSGKDSLYNVFVPPSGVADPVCSTLVITAVGIVRHVDNVPLTGVVSPGDDIWLVGPSTGALGGSHLDAVLGSDHGGAVPQPDASAIERHHQMHNAIAAGVVRSAHDISEGGLAVSAAEWAHAGRLGVEITLAATPDVLFGEGAGRYLVEVDLQNRERFAELVPTATRVGAVTGGSSVTIGGLSVPLTEVSAAYLGGMA